MPWAMSWDDKKPKRKKERSHPVRQDKAAPPAVHARSVRELHCSRYCSQP
nr:MAG TPA: interferon regulatory factor 2-binding protein [Caudoviricetes sp.]